jgi:hypothetical protein
MLCIEYEAPKNAEGPRSIDYSAWLGRNKKRASSYMDSTAIATTFKIFTLYHESRVKGTSTGTY